MFAGTNDGVCRSTDRGATFKRTDFPDKGSRSGRSWSTAAIPSACFAGGSPVDVYRSDDGGESWKQLPDAGDRHALPRGRSPPASCASRSIPSKPDEIYAALEVNGVMRSTDGGETWSDCSDGPDHALRASRISRARSSATPTAEGMLDGHAICHQRGRSRLRRSWRVRMGLFRSRDDGKSWQDMEVGPLLADHLRPRHQGLAARSPTRSTRALASPPPAKDGGALSQRRTAARPGSASTRSRCTARSCRSACIHSDRQAGLYRRALRRRGVRHPGWRQDLAARCRCRGEVQHIYAVACG